MPNEAPEPRHWPFTDEALAGESSTSLRAALARKDAQTSAQMMHREIARTNRLIVGGRAHKRQHGLS